jgi:hypothetical protein
MIPRNSTAANQNSSYLQTQNSTKENTNLLSKNINDSLLNAKSGLAENKINIKLNINSEVINNNIRISKGRISKDKTGKEIVNNIFVIKDFIKE